ncbi:ABC transporter substrate-binding protein [Vibrio sp. Sgm 22]|uniref:ABC transporter substrate-binding protein n=1 Tax=unclassified Vibrio TaxID=2614977 RepID=UPI0022490C5E|nr:MULTISPECIES: ABC transporter substrate-binding protein [unclassified Vibrio]MCX2757737.1 ABC transporter substrate-binding protein [Vibrio sp. 14G-20]MCX2774985.1 ABC transporter substrate-binding protein [Vibrio sp. Sgm 22]
MMLKHSFQSILHRSHVTRTLISSVVISSLLAVTPVSVAQKDMLDVSSDPSPRLVSIDWTHTETLLALGVNPVAAAQIPDYNSWVKSPKIPPTVADVGLRTQPNLERIHELKPDKILLSPMFSMLETQLSKIAPVTTIGLYRSGDVDWSALETVTRKLAEVSEKQPQAEVLIQKANAEMDRLGLQLPNNAPAMLMVQFMDTNHVRVFGDNSLYKASVNKIGLESAWKGQTNAWGYSLVGVDQLIGVKGQIVIISPMPAGTEESLKANQFWQYIVKESGYPALQVPAVWSFGAIPSATRFARFIVSELNQGDVL